MNTCCFLASILICNIVNGITQKWMLHIYVYSTMYIEYTAYQSSKGYKFSYPVLLIASDIQWKYFHFIRRKLLLTPDPSNTYTHTCNHIDTYHLPYTVRIHDVIYLWFEEFHVNNVFTLTVSFVSFYVLTI